MLVGQFQLGGWISHFLVLIFKIWLFGNLNFRFIGCTIMVFQFTNSDNIVIAKIEAHLNFIWMVFFYFYNKYEYKWMCGTEGPIAIYCLVSCEPSLFFTILKKSWNIGIIKKLKCWRIIVGRPPTNIHWLNKYEMLQKIT